MRLQSGADADITQCGDYINASAIYDSDPRTPVYIVAQAPMLTTSAEFWQMIWEQGSVVIVNLTKLAENGDAKCHRYWPENGSEVHGVFEVGSDTLSSSSITVVLMMITRCGSRFIWYRSTSGARTTWFGRST